MSVLARNELPPRHWLNVRPISARGNRPAAGREDPAAMLPTMET